MKFDQGQNCRAELLDICIDRGVVERVWPGTRFYARLYAQTFRMYACAEDRKVRIKLKLLQN